MQCRAVTVTMETHGSTEKLPPPCARQPGGPETGARGKGNED